jgi:hypothetical protein
LWSESRAPGGEPRLELLRWEYRRPGLKLLVAVWWYLSAAGGKIVLFSWELRYCLIVELKMDAISIIKLKMTDQDNIMLQISEDSLKQLSGLSYKNQFKNLNWTSDLN